MSTVEYFTAPDLSVTITQPEAMKALELFDHCDWDGIEAKIKPGTLDTNGLPVNRYNRNLRVMVLAETVTVARSGRMGEGIDLMDNPHFEFMINAMLDSFDEATK